MMTLDDRATDEKADPHTATLRCVERLEELVHIVRFQTDARILHGQARTIVFVPFGSDHQLPRTIVDSVHGVRGVPEQVEDDLLKLDTIACDSREAVGKVRAQNHPASLEFTPR